MKTTIIKRCTASHEVDPQKGFSPLCPNELPVPDGDNIVKELNRQAKYGIIRTVSKDVHPSNAIWISNENTPQFTELNIPNEKNVDLSWNSHCMSGTEGSELLPGLPPITTYNFIVFKGVEPNLHPYSSCYHDIEKKISTGLLEFYKENKIKAVIVGGLALDYCVLETVKDFQKAGLRVIVNLSATRAIGNVEDTINEIRKLEYQRVEIINSVKDLQIMDVNC